MGTIFIQRDRNIYHITCIHGYLLIVPHQKVAVSAWLEVVAHGVKSIPVSVGLNEGCVPVDTPTLKSIEFWSEGESVKEILPWRLQEASYL